MALTLPRMLLMAALTCLALSAWEGQRVIRIHGWNRLIGDARSTADGVVRSQPPAAVRFAAAFAAGARGDLRQALDLYREMQTSADPRWRHDALFNSGNLYLQQALNRPTAANLQQPPSGELVLDSSARLTLIELAKQSYRDLLREDSEDWDARFNLERALRLAPDPEEDSEAMSTPPSRLHTPTTGHGSSLGLP